MKRQVLYLIPFILFLGSNLFSFAQTKKDLPQRKEFKYENESRVSPAEVPKPALEFVQAALGDKRVKWYSEESLDHNSFEAKTRFRKLKFSIEFDTLGVLEDIEIDLKRKALPSDVAPVIESAFDSLFQKWAYHKLQRQLTGEEQDLIYYVQGSEKQMHTLRYEIEVKGRKEGHWKMYEVLFSEKGKVLNVAEIILRNIDHLEF